MCGALSVVAKCVYCNSQVLESYMTEHLKLSHGYFQSREQGEHVVECSRCGLLCSPSEGGSPFVYYEDLDGAPCKEYVGVRWETDGYELCSICAVLADKSFGDNLFVEPFEGGKGLVLAFVSFMNEKGRMFSVKRSV